SGRPIRKISKDQLDGERPSWPTEAASTTILHWMPHVNEPTRFMVYPPADTGTIVRTLVVPRPANGDTQIYVLDRMLDACIYYGVAQCYNLDATYAQKAMDYDARFLKELSFETTANKVNAAETQQRQPPR